MLSNFALCIMLPAQLALFGEWINAGVHLGTGTCNTASSCWPATLGLRGFGNSELELFWLQTSLVTWICSLITSASSGFHREYS